MDVTQPLITSVLGYPLSADVKVSPRDVLMCVNVNVPVTADDDVAHEEAEQDEPVGVEQALVQAQGPHAPNHLQMQRFGRLLLI